MFRWCAAVAMGGVAFALAAEPAVALDPHTALAQYGYQSWQTDTGLPQNTVHAIAQGAQGFLWIATEGGLVRFDGEQFEALTRATTPGLPSDLIDDLMVDGRGMLWISTSGGLARIRDGKLEAFGAARGVPATQIWRTWQQDGPPDHDAPVWVLTAAGLFRIVNDRGQRVALDQDLTENSTMAAGRGGALWLGTAEGLLRSGGDGQPFRPVGATGEVLALAVDGQGAAWAGLRSGLEQCTAAGCRNLALPGGGAVNALVTDGAGQVWIGTDAGLFVGRGDAIRPVAQPTGRVTFLYADREGMVWAGTAHALLRIAPENGDAVDRLPSGDVYLSAAEDREGDLWLGTESGGLAVLRDRKFSALTAQNGLSDDYVLSLAQGPDGTAWVGTNGGGLNRYRKGRFEPLTTAQGLASDVVLSVAAAGNGDVWAGTPDGLNLIGDGKVRVFTTADGLADDFVRSLLVDPAGALWIGTRNGLSRYQNGAFTSWSALDGLGSDLVGALAEGRDGTLWIGTLGGLSQLRNGRIRNFTTKDGLSSNVVTALHLDGDGTLWIGTNDGGLNRMQTGKITPVAAQELPPRVLGILEDASGYLWISSNSGVYRVSRDALKRAAGGAPAPEVMRFGVADGMRISECSSGGHPAALRLHDGTLWFATLKGIAAVDPEHMPMNRVPPPVRIEQVRVDDQLQSGIRDLHIAPGHRDYEFDYAGLSFVAPQKVAYRYQLVGFDRAWVDAGTRRAAFYTNLPHGHYTFRVIARNNDGVWSPAPATAELTVEPHLVQTLWFQLLVVLALVGLAAIAWRQRLLRVEREFQAVLGERARIAREIHDTLAQGFVAVSVQLELIAQLMHTSVGAARDQLERAQAMVRSSLEDARLSIWELRSQTPEREDLAARLLKMAEEVVARAGSRARVAMQVQGTYRPLEADVEQQVARIAREAVTNAARHGDPENILLRLEFDGSMFGMEVRDDGKGFAGTPPDGSTGHFGLTGMRERAAAIGATLTVESAAGTGTRVQLTLPLGREAGKKA